MSKTRRNFTSKFNADIVIELLKGEKSINDTRQMAAQLKSRGYQTGSKKVRRFMTEMAIEMFARVWMARAAGLTTS